MPLSLMQDARCYTRRGPGSNPGGAAKDRISGTAVVAAATVPINRPGDEPDANDHLANISLAGLICQSLAEAIPSHDEG
jgi:hypothetical protein